MVLEIIGGGQQSKVAADDWPLIQPSEVQVAVPPVLTAEPRLTPLGMTINAQRTLTAFSPLSLA